MPLTILAGPAGGGKSQLASAILEEGEVDVLADTTGMWVAISGVERGPDGRYPERQDDDPALAAARAAKLAAIRVGLRTGARVLATTSSRDDSTLRRIAGEEDAPVRQIVEDPGRAVVEDRLRGADGRLSRACAAAVGRWYD